LGRVASADHVPQGAAALEALVDVLQLSVPHRAEAPGHPVVLQNSVGVLPQRPGLYSSQVVEEAEVVVMCAVLMDTWKRQAAAVDSLTPAEI